MEEIEPEQFADCWIGEAPCCNCACVYRGQTFPRKPACYHEGRGEVCCGVLFMILLGSGKSFNISLATHTASSISKTKPDNGEKVQGCLDIVFEANLWLAGHKGEFQKYTMCAICAKCSSPRAGYATPSEDNL